MYILFIYTVYIDIYIHCAARARVCVCVCVCVCDILYIKQFLFHVKLNEHCNVI